MQTMLLLAFLAATDPAIAITAAISGVSAANLSATPATSAINMEATRPSNQLSLRLAITPGTTATVDVRCYESQDGVLWDAINTCDSTSPKSVCVPDVRTYTLANYTGSVRCIASRWQVTKKYVQCTFDDPLDGTGTITVTGARSWQ